MEPMKQCPQCGKYVAADRTYCMNCGVTLGIRCPNCRAVMPVGAKTCTACGHSFVKKKKSFRFPLWAWMKANARPLLLGAVALLFVLTLVSAAFPGQALSVSEDGLAFIEHEVSGYSLMRYFLGAHPAGMDALLGMSEVKDSASVLKILFFGEGLGWLMLAVGLPFCLCLLLCNYKRMGRATARRLYLPLGLSVGGAVLLYTLSAVAGGILKAAMADYAADPEAAVVISATAVMPLVVLIASLAVMALHAVLYFGVFRAAVQEEEAEWSLNQILAVPIGYAIRFVRRVIRRLSGKKGKRVVDRYERDEPTFTVTSRFSSYIILLIVSLIFTQALLSKVSHIFFWFVFLLPWVLLLYTVLAKHALSVSMLSDSLTTEKNTPYTYRFRIDNRSPFAIPFMEAQVSIPQANSVRCTERTVRLSMAPLSSYTMKNTVSFRFRGTYEIGVKCFYIYDFFRIFRFRADVDSLITVYVLPRRLTLDETLAQAISDSTVRTVRSPLVVDKLEVSDIRDYQNGDPLKSIHWKLSSKSENFIVKDYNTGTSNQTVVFCDLTPHFPDEPPKKKAGGEGDGSDNQGKKKQIGAEKKSAKQSRKDKKAAMKAAADLKRKNKRIRVSANTQAISDEDLQARLEQRAAVADILDEKNGTAVGDSAAASPRAPEAVETVDVHELAAPAHYEDMNEYLADGVVELTIASVLAELQQGHEVMLLWFDRRSDTGVFAYPLRGVDEFENIYHLFATAPLCAPDRKVTSLTAMISDIQSAKQMFVISTLDTEMLTDLCALPGVSDAGSFDSAEVVLYNPEERFRYPKERAAYLESCRQQLSANGLSLTAGSFSVARPVSQPEGGQPHEA